MIYRQDVSDTLCPRILEYCNSCKIEKEKEKSCCADEIGINLVSEREQDGQYRI